MVVLVPRRLRSVGVAAALAVLAGCGAKEQATRWIPDDAALVRCTTAGRHRMAPVLLDLPVPRVPTGLLARQLDPMALNDMGYEREQPVCAALLRPDEEATETTRATMTELLTTYASTGAAVRSTLGRCACDIAREAEVDALVAPCRDEPHRPSCNPSNEERQRALELVEPLRQALAETAIPRLHWRLAGRTDRPTWMVDRITELLPRHAGGATVLRAGQAIPSRHNHVLVRRLFDEPGVQAVVREDGGRALLVIRHLDGALVLDWLAFPSVAPTLTGLLPFIDEARADAVAQRLTQPATAYVPSAPLDKGNIISIDRRGLRAVDAMLLAAAPLAGIKEAPGRLPPPPEPPLVDRVTLQAPFGNKGERLVAQLRLSEAGTQWAQTLSGAALAAGVDALGLTPSEDAAPPADDQTQREGWETLGFVAHGQPVERIVLDGLPHIAELFRRLEMNHPGALLGTVDAWEIEVPPGAIGPGGTVPPAPELRGWSERIAERAHRVEASFDPPREVLRVELRPK